MNHCASIAQPMVDGLERPSSPCPPTVSTGRPCAVPPTPVSGRKLDDIARQAVVLDWLGQQQVVFHRIYVDIAGGVLPALWLSHVLSHLLVTLQRTPDAVGDAECVFAIDTGLCEVETGLTAAEQYRCISSMAELGLAVPDRARNPKTCRLRLQRLVDLMVEHSAPLESALRGAAGSAPELDLLEARSRVRRDKLRRKVA